jgi:hypothetical protein
MQLFIKILTVIYLVIASCGCENSRTSIANIKISKSGLIFISANLEGYEAYFLFDTGSEISIIRDKYVNKRKIDEGKKIKLLDALGNVQIRTLIEWDGLEIGNIPLGSFNYVAVDDSFFNALETDLESETIEIAGIIGANMLSLFNWDFSFVENRVAINKNITTSDDSLYIEFNPKEGGFYSRLQVNDSIADFIIDTGCNTPLELANLIPGERKFFVSGVELRNYSMASAFENKKSETKLGFVDLALNRDKFINTLCSYNRINNIVGVSIFHNYERVIFSFESAKIFLYRGKNNYNPLYSSVNISNQRVNNLIRRKLTVDKQSKINLRDSIYYPIKRILATNDTIRSRFVIYSGYLLKEDESRFINLIVTDSLKLPDGEIVYPEYKIGISNGIWKDKR